VVIEALTPAGVHTAVDELVAILADAVEGGASVGFLPPVERGVGAQYWQSVADAVVDGSRVLLVARDDTARVVGTVQLDLATRANGRHRAEVVRLMVHRSARRRGIGRALMLAVQDEAVRRGRTTLHLDTRQGDESERLYRSLGWRLAGLIPEWAQSADGTLHATAFYYLRPGKPADAT
jgi:ribosomal protein S18 acetylase RimI-like enzyme